MKEQTDKKSATTQTKEQAVLKLWKERLKDVLAQMPSFMLKDNPEMQKGMYDSADLVKKAIDNLNKYL